MKKKLIASIICILICFTVEGQEAQLSKISQSLYKYNVNNLVEKLYVHTDRETYLAGETIWYKFYYVNGFDNKPLDMSKVAYLELVDKDNKPILKIKSSLNDGTGNGSLFIPVDINSGNYLLRAYTSWMQNSAPEFYFHKEVTIVNTFKSLGDIASQKTTEASLQIFPEGGYLVSSLPANVALSMKPQDLSAKALLIQNNSDTLQSIEFQELGLASFRLTPEVNNDYQVWLVNEHGDILFKKELQIEEAGYSLAVEKYDDQVKIKVHTNLNVPLVNLVIHHNQQISQAKTGYFKEGEIEFFIDNKDLADYLSHITIFDVTGKPVAESLYYKPGKKQLDIELTVPSLKFKPREEVKVQIGTFNEKQNAQDANLSVSVKQLFDFSKNSFTDIQQYMTISSDLAGIDYDFTHLDEQTIDLIMLTAGWRRFRWDNILNPDFKNEIGHQPELNGHLIKGKVLARKSQQPASYVKAYLSIPGKKAQIYGGLSDKNGIIFFEPHDFYQKNQIVVQTKNDSLYQLSIENPFSEDYMDWQWTDFKLEEKFADQLNQRSVNVQVQNTYYGDKFRRSVLPDIDSTAFFGKPDATYYLDDYTRFPTMEDVMREYVANVWLRKNRNGYYFLVYDEPNKDVFRNSSLVLLDGVPIFNTDKIIDYDPLNVQKIDIVKRMYLHGLLTCEGIVSLTTYDGNLKDFPLDPRTLIIDYEGLQAKREFYMPDHYQQNSNLPDFRTLLYWQPNINSNHGKAKFEFFTSDQYGKFLIEVQGMTDDGRFGSEKIMIDVSGEQVN